jgi:hypothetical protein
MNKLNRLGIIQPGKVGDIIICLPIAKYYFDKGYEVIWPVDKNIIDNFIGYIDYVKFVPIDYLHCGIAKKICIEQEWCNTIIDLSFCLPGSWEGRNTTLFQENTLPFDQLKYQIAQVPFEEKWNLQYTSNQTNENFLYEKYYENLHTKQYIVAHWQGSDYQRKIQLENTNNMPIIEIKPITKSVFDWTNILTKATALVLIDSCFANLVEQLNLTQKKIFLTRPSPRPTLKHNWTII